MQPSVFYLSIYWNSPYYCSRKLCIITICTATCDVITALNMFKVTKIYCVVATRLHIFPEGEGGSVTVGWGAASLRLISGKTLKEGL